ncbi:MAG: hypothetical protein CMK09_17140 [Ponticaulis sp.]|nr:hypothetical protein [Ponticaulis sp.]|tara:strand:+ start:7497 stop:7793 length:297 start_codon:yes stop_codon:yes gene_type:complete
MKRILALILAACVVTTPASAQFMPSTNLLPEQDRNAVRNGQQLSLKQIYDRLRSRYGGGEPRGTSECEGGNYCIRWEVNGRILDLVVDKNGRVLRERR